MSKISLNTYTLINKKNWLKEGFIIQNLKGIYILGEGPFVYGNKARPYSLYHPDFFLKNKNPWIYPSSICQFNKKELIDFLFPIKKDLYKKNQKNFVLFEKSQSVSFNLYQDCFIKAQFAIKQKQFQKVVPAFCEIFLNTAPILNLLENLFKNTFNLKQGFLYGYWNREKGILGFTPEFLFSIDQKKFSTMALAGTTKQNSSSLLKSSKEVKEHEFVVKNLKENLDSLVSWEKKKRSEMIFPPLKHIKTELKGEWITPFDFQTICQLLHPTPAVGGYPQKSAWFWLKKQRSQKDRTYFSAPFAFYENKSKAFCLVALRSLEWNRKRSFIFSGGGWIKESQLQKEWHELYLKRQQVKNFFK